MLATDDQIVGAGARIVVTLVVADDQVAQAVGRTFGRPAAATDVDIAADEIDLGSAG